MASSEAVWACLDPSTDDWQPASVVARHGSTNTVEVLFDSSGARHMLPPAQVLPQNGPEQDRTPDLAQLVHLSEPCLLHTLGCRYSEGAIYTYTGTILIALNPWRELSLYSEEQLACYRDQPLGALPPHLFAIADLAYTGMRQERDDQTILVSGESGAGKTESTRRLLEYLVAASSRQLAAGGGGGGGGSGGLAAAGHLQRKLLQANPLLETLGNAKTLRNDNSSRFGKFIQVYFDAGGGIAGGAVRTYLLEKSRVVQQAKGERNCRTVRASSRRWCQPALAFAGSSDCIRRPGAALRSSEERPISSDSIERP